MVGNCAANASTSCLRASISGYLPLGQSASASLKSLSLDPTDALMVLAMWMPFTTRSATFSKSASTKPRVVSAGVPRRRPPGTMADTSPGTVFLLQAMCASSSTRSTRAPSMSIPRRSHSTRWLSVPPDTSSMPCFLRRPVMACMLAITCVWYALNSGDAACLSATASPAMVWLWGPPCSPGNTAKLILSSRSYMTGLPFLSTPFWPLRKKIMAPRGPRRDLCVVVVTTSAWSNGDGMMPAATRPEMCAMSASR
mmetsp:Transcript_17496/g.43177  ORF Transcript_17496/g.43177 Transcript_17496/m.43177 type:complete len:254 (-) Transcript_17496:828-1589(-)